MNWGQRELNIQTIHRGAVVVWTGDQAHNGQWSCGGAGTGSFLSHSPCTGSQSDSEVAPEQHVLGSFQQLIRAKQMVQERAVYRSPLHSQTLAWTGAGNKHWQHWWKDTVCFGLAVGCWCSLTQLDCSGGHQVQARVSQRVHLQPGTCSPQTGLH